MYLSSQLPPKHYSISHAILDLKGCRVPATIFFGFPWTYLGSPLDFGLSHPVPKYFKNPCSSSCQVLFCFVFTLDQNFCHQFPSLPPTFCCLLFPVGWAWHRIHRSQWRLIRRSAYWLMPMGSSLNRHDSAQWSDLKMERSQFRHSASLLIIPNFQNNCLTMDWKETDLSLFKSLNAIIP